MTNYGRLRWLVQILFAAITLWIGYDFIVFYQQAMAGGEVDAARPPGVEAFLPISALLAAKRLLLSGQWDDVHPAGLALLLAIMAGALVARRAFCSWVCPIGLASRVLETLRRRVLRLPPRWAVPGWLRRVACLVKYPLLALFVWLVASMPLVGIEAFLHQPYNIAADGAMLLFFANLSFTGAAIIVLLVLFSLVVRNGWCRVLCPYGALLGLIGVLSPLRVVRDPASCHDCGACSRACPSGIPVSRGTIVHSLECTACLSCIESCRFPGVLTVRSHWGHVLRPWLMPGAAIVLLFVSIGLAQATGHWQSQLSWRAFQAAYLMHPGH